MPSPMQVLSRLTVATVTGGVLLSGLPAAADHQHLPPGRRITPYTVKSGDTATGLAVRFHAWTAELISYNHLGRARLAARGPADQDPGGAGGAAEEQAAPHEAQGPQAAPRRSTTPRKQHTKKKHGSKKSTRSPTPAARQCGASVARTARRHGVEPQLALAICWQESGWQMDRVSSAARDRRDAGAPATGVWMSMYAGRRLHIRGSHDNVLAGVLLLDVLDDLTRTRWNMIGAYYQGLGAVREHGLYRTRGATSATWRRSSAASSGVCRRPEAP